MSRVLLSFLFAACASAANAQWEKVADFTQPKAYGYGIFGQTIFITNGLTFTPEYYFSEDQGKSFDTLTTTGLPSDLQMGPLYLAPDYFMTIPYAGGWYSQQLYRLLPGAQSWEPLGTPIPDSAWVGITQVGRQGQNIIAVVYDGIYQWMYHSHDEGTTWAPCDSTTGLPPGFPVGTLISNDSVALAIGDYNSESFFSTDGGASWQACTYGPGVCPISYYAQTWWQPGELIYGGDTCQHKVCSVDGGKSWKLCPVGYALTSGNSMFGIVGDSLFRSDDQWDTWTSTALNVPFATHFAITPNGNFLCYSNSFSNNKGIYISTDTGATWTKVMDTPFLSADAFFSLHTGGSLAYIVGQGGFFVSADQGLTWKDRSEAINQDPASIYICDADGPFLIASGDGGNSGFNDCSTSFVSHDWGATWEQILLCGEWRTNLTIRPEGIYCTARNGLDIDGVGHTLLRSTDEGASWQGVALPAGGGWEFAREGGSKLFVMGSVVQTGDPAKVVVSDSTGGNWAYANSGLPSDILVEGLAYDTTTGKVYASNRFGIPGIYLSSDLGKTWTTVFSDGGGPSVAAEKGHVCVVGRKDKVYISHDEGETWKTVADTILMGLRGNAGALELVAGNLIMGSNYGVLRSTDYGETWAPFNEGLPMNTQAFEVVVDDHYLYIAAGDDGLYRRPLTDVTSGTRPEAVAGALTLKVAPNPSADGIFELKIGDTSPQPLQLLVMDVTGKCLLRSSFSGQQQSVNLSAAPAGVYWLQLVSENGTAVRRLVKTGR